MKKSKIPTIIGLVVLVFGLAAGVYLVKNTTFFRLGASEEDAPLDVRITNTTDNSFTVNWVTSKQNTGFIKYGEVENNLSKIDTDDLGTSGYTHTSTINGLAPEKTYFFKINSGGADFDNNGLAWQINTGPTIPTNPKQLTISGSVLKQTGQPAENAIVYVTVAGSSTLSSTTSKNGSWVIPLGSARTQDLSAFILIQESSSLLEISINAGADGVASAQIYPQSSRPVPAITLGTTNDFKSNPPSTNDGSPTANLSIPDQTEKESSFNVDGTAVTTNKTVTLESITDGEKIATEKPEFFGEGPSGVTLSITVESDPQSTEVKVPTTGDWKWTPPANLGPGNHTVTITWRDAAGILRKLTRTFVVEASENPSFIATPSATISVSPTATKTPTPTATTTPSITATKTPTIISTPSATVAPTIPDSGSLTPTIILFMMGIATILFATIVWKKSEINA
jgi:hypothetical protein